MRRAARETIKTEDIEAIVRNQVQRAKEGDQAAIKFIFGEVLGGNELKGATFVQNVFDPGQPLPTKPAKIKPGSEQKIELMRQRIATGNNNGAFHPEDQDGVDLS